MKKHKYEKTLGIVNELMLCCYRLGCLDMTIHTELKPEFAVYTVHAPLAEADPEELQKIENTLNHARQPEIEETYWGLGGVSASQDSMKLIGIMVDEGEVRHENGELTITAKRWRKEKR